MSYGLTIHVEDTVGPALQRMHATLAERADINDAIGAGLVSLCQRYVDIDAASRHATAAALGGNPTGFVGAASDAIHSTPDASGVTVDFQHPWFARVRHDVDIYPKDGHKYLAIPIAAESYGVRLKGSDFGGFFFHSKNGGLFYGRDYAGHGGAIQPLYVLVTEVHQKQDRTRLPSDDEIVQNVRATLKDEIGQRLAALPGGTNAN